MATPTTRSLEIGPHEQEALRAFLSAARLLSEDLNQELHREAGMRQIHYEILTRLEEAPGHRLGMTDLARRSVVSKSRLTHLVARLEALSWVRRLDNPLDGRCQVAELSDAGLAALREATRWHAQCAQERFVDLLSGEQVGQLRQISEILLGWLPCPTSSHEADASGQQYESNAELTAK
ncbi:MarR family transcriptional regulator [Streptomyces sp. NPDC052207]|uniref:MarR family winged helix-turn-helix transcriptional regulator n=1 Tax=Streptomyces sp. NPDC052207 TaxID=3155418 RepID=UPI00342BFCA0